MKKQAVLISGWAAGAGVFGSITGRLGNMEFTYLPWEKCISEPGYALTRIKNIRSKVVLIAWSLGALVAIKAAGEEPELFDGLCLISGTARMAQDKDYPGVKNRDIKAMAARLDKHKTAVIEGFADNCFYPGVAGRSEFLAGAGEFPVSDLAKGLSYLETADYRDLTGAITAKTFIMHGLKDRIIPFSQSEYIHSRVKGSVLRSFDSGHNLPCELPGEAVEIIGGM